MPNQDNFFQRKPNVLIVDDDATICLLMKEALNDKEFAVTEVSNGIDALTEIKKSQPDLVLLDVTMPGMDGFEVCTEIRRLYGDTNISIIMVTALEDPVSIEKSYDSGATDFISKPINWDTLPYRVKYLLKARSAILDMQLHRLHLEYMEHISRIITQNQQNDIIVQETMLAMLDIFSADHAILVKPDVVKEDNFVVDCETASDTLETRSYLNSSIVDTLEKDILLRAKNSEYPIISHYDLGNTPQNSNPLLKQQMICALHLKQAQNWYLIVQQNTIKNIWSNQDEETFYKISLRLSNMLSRHILTEELTRSESLLKQALEISQLGNWHWSASSNYLTWSDTVYKIYGRSQQTYSPDLKTYFENDFEEDNDRIQLLNDIKDNINNSFQVDHRIRLPDKSIRWIHEQCIAKYDRLGNLQEINGIVQDVTEARIKKEHEAHNKKMESIGQLTSGIAHDFGNLMTVAKGNLELLEESFLDEDAAQENRELLDDALSAVNDSVSLTKQLLYFSRKKSIAPIDVNIEQTLDNYKIQFKKTLGQNISISFTIEPDLNDILVDPSQFNNALLNIIINARNAMPDGGEIKIVAKTINTKEYQGIVCKTEQAIGDECICIIITDNGSGMSNNVIERAIEPFYTTQENQGTGLGLSMVYGFIKQSGGDLLIQSERGHGTSIYLFLPISNNIKINDIGIVKEKIDKQSLKDTHSTVLIVEDRYSVRQYAVRCLNKTGLTLLQADDATSAIKILDSNHVDLLFTDIIMPGKMDGKKLAEWVDKKYPKIKILLTTAIDKTSSESSVRNFHVMENPDTNKFETLIKPYSKYELINNIERLLEIPIQQEKSQV